MSNKQKLKINSCDRLNPETSTPSDFTIELDHVLQGGYQLHYVKIPLMYQNISAKNNRLHFRENEEDKIAYLAVGKYVGATVLKTNVLEALNDASDGTNTYTATYDSLTNFFTFTASSVDFSFTFSNTECSCAENLGFAPIDYDSTDLSLTAIRAFNLSTIQSINIDINGINTVSDSNTATDPTFFVPVLDNIGTIQFWVPPANSVDQFTITAANKTNTLNIRIVDDNNEVLELEHNWSMVFKKIHN